MPCDGDDGDDGDDEYANLCILCFLLCLFFIYSSLSIFLLLPSLSPITLPLLQSSPLSPLYYYYYYYYYYYSNLLHTLSTCFLPISFIAQVFSQNFVDSETGQSFIPVMNTPASDDVFFTFCACSIVIVIGYFHVLGWVDWNVKWTRVIKSLTGYNLYTKYVHPYVRYFCIMLVGMLCCCWPWNNQTKNYNEYDNEYDNEGSKHLYSNHYMSPRNSLPSSHSEHYNSSYGYGHSSPFHSTKGIDGRMAPEGEIRHLTQQANGEFRSRR